MKLFGTSITGLLLFVVSAALTMTTEAAAAITKPPTNRPTKFPTLPPSSKPPTKGPTLAPTKSPTKPPTLSPVPPKSKPPTKFPTRFPTRFPTKRPSLPPTQPPTAAATLASLIASPLGCPNAANDVLTNSAAGGGNNNNTYQGKAVAFINDVLATGRTLTAAKMVQYYALASIYHATGGKQWSIKYNWLSLSLDPCDSSHPWIDIFCDSNGAITKLYLFSNNLNGTLPCEVVLLSADHPSQAGKLSRLDLSGNSLLNTVGSTGTPQWIAGLGSSLSFLSFSHTSFGTTIPADLGTRLPRLASLVAYGAHVTGDLSFLHGVNSLENVVVGANQIQGNLIPSILGELSRLRTFDANSNLLVGTLPTELGLLTNLTSLDVSDNVLQGKLPTQLGLLTRINLFWAYRNQLTGTLPTELALMNNASYLALYTNQLVGTIPAAYGSAPWVEFHVEDNRLSGALPLTFCNSNNNNNNNEASFGVDCGVNALHPVSCNDCPTLCCCSLSACND